MTTESKVIREIYEIREKLFEEMKTMTPEEYTALVNRETDELSKQYGFKIESSPSALPAR